MSEKKNEGQDSEVDNSEEARAARAAEAEKLRLETEAEEKRIKDEAEAAEAKAKETAAVKARQEAEAEENARKAKQSKKKASAKRQQVNPNAPQTEAEKLKALKNLNSDIDGSAFRDGLPDDVEALKDQLVKLNSETEDAEKEIADLRHKERQNQHKVDGFEKLKGQLNTEIRNTQSKLKPLVGMHDEDRLTEVLAAPIGDQGQGRVPVMLILFHDGRPVNIHVTDKAMQISEDGSDRWLLR